ncbi:glycosyltransferase family 4 protein [uncultured Alteromonas sp.]|uniref:glycosyltransferase family 4 protein n=1 Tax=uncultured Alteromonas sp. TaxID=179113 RepID=UPI0025E35829|nr:glycosyltransferase family 4 protein [uncultured Alteromonas sp.]
MKVALYLENQNIANVNLRHPELGNPGVGGTEFNFITLAIELQRRYPFIDITLMAQSTALLPVELKVVQAQDCLAAVNCAVERGCELFIWRPTVRADAAELISRLESYAMAFVIWAHNTPQQEYLAAFAKATNVKSVVAVGEWQHQSIQYPAIQSKLTHIYNGFNAVSYQGDVLKDPNLVVYTGSLIPVKGFGLLAQAWPKVLKKCPTARLLVIGSGQLYDRNATLGPWNIADEQFENEHIIPFLSTSEGLPHPSVVFTGIMGIHKIPLLKSAICGVVNPSGKGENCPGSAIEFMASGTAVVSAASEGVQDIITDGFTGLLGDGVEALSANLITLLQHPEQAIKLGENGPWEVHKRFSYSRICAQWLAILVAANRLSVEYYVEKH